jgi:aryl-alcohol dehydrogenase-like predicted oxidoreductase
VALAWTLVHPAMTAPIIGPRTLQQLEGALRVVELKLDESALKRLDEIFPGHGGDAPRAYAW